MSTAVPSPVVWLRWVSPPQGSEVGEVERLPRVLAEVFVARGAAVEVDPATLPADVRRRGGTGA